MRYYSRPLDQNKLAVDFLTKVLGLKNTTELGDQIQRLVSAEKLLSATVNKPTLTSDENRHTSFLTDEARTALRTKIFEELITNVRLDNDDDIVLGKGGVLPQSGLKSEKNAYIVTGLPASGKSTISNLIAEHTGSAIVDSDYAKRKFPEFCLAQGASIVHMESSLVTNGSTRPEYEDEKSVYEYMVMEGANIVIPKIGYDCISITNIRDALIEADYRVHLIFVSVDRKVSTTRAFDRFLTTERYVPLGLVFDEYSNDPTLTYYRLRDDPKWQSVGKVNTESNEPKVIYATEGCPLIEIYGDAKHE
ncbi:zeta toxin family protein [Vibrio fluvialis]|nr:zeta toxin family protein [Vibrio fluvialis]